MLNKSQIGIASVNLVFFVLCSNIDRRIPQHYGQDEGTV